MIEFLFILILLCFIYSLKHFYVYINPTSTFLIGLLGAVGVSILYKKEWNMDQFHLNTFTIIVLGILSFTVVSSLVQQKYGVTEYQKHTISSFKFGKITLSTLLFLLVLITYWEYKTKINISHSTGIADALYTMDQEYKQGDQSMYELPVLLRNLIFLRDIICLYFFYILAKSIAVKKYNSEFIYDIVICTIGFLGAILTGSRGNAVTLVLFFLFVWSVYKARSSNMLKHLSLKRIIYFCIALFASLTVFIKSTEWVGRSLGDIEPGYYFAIYCGAEIKNLDIFMNENQPPNNYFGEHTFSGLTPKSKQSREAAIEYISFQTINGYPLGNVYTIFQDLYKDFGYIGVVVLIGLMAFIMQFLFSRALNSPGLYDKPFDLFIFLYSYLSTTVVYSFFSDRFYGKLNWPFLKLLIELVVFAYIMKRMSKKECANT